MIFVLKSLVAAAIVIVVMQFEVGGTSLESRAEHWLVSSPVSLQLRQVASGAIKVSQDLGRQSLKWMGLQSAPSTPKREWSVEFRHRRAKDEGSQKGE